MTAALTTTGAQNLTAGKIAKVLENVNAYLNRGVVAAHHADFDEDDESDD
jgi:DNA polymerase III epsilon subunit-like protein